MNFFEEYDKEKQNIKEEATAEVNEDKAQPENEESAEDENLQKLHGIAAQIMLARAKKAKCACLPA